MVKQAVWEGYNIGKHENRQDPLIRRYIVTNWPRWPADVKALFKVGIKHGLEDRPTRGG